MEQFQTWLKRQAPTVGRYGCACAGAWGVENSFHWILDVAFLYYAEKVSAILTFPHTEQRQRYNPAGRGDTVLVFKCGHNAACVPPQNRLFAVSSHDCATLF